MKCNGIGLGGIRENKGALSVEGGSTGDKIRGGISLTLGLE